MQGLSNTLHETPMNLALDQQRVDDVAAIIDRHILHDLRLTRFCIDLHDTDVRAERECEVRRLEVTRRIQAWLDAWRQFHSVVSRRHHIDKTNGPRRGAFYNELSDSKFDFLRCRLQK